MALLKAKRFDKKKIFVKERTDRCGWLKDVSRTEEDVSNWLFSKVSELLEEDMSN